MNWIKKVQPQVDKVLKYSQSLPIVQTDKLLSAWLKAKTPFIERMGGLIWESDEITTFELDEESRHDKIDEFLDWVEHEYGEEMHQFFIMNYDSILENKLSVKFENYPVGMKLSRVLMQAFGEDAEEVRRQLSMLIQSNKVSGKLCLSVHPLDFLSSSENQHSWRSCHALDGEYRSGNLSYMCDPNTIIAYLKTPDEEVRLPRFPTDVLWNNKKWRCLFFRDANNSQIWAGRQYPFSTDTALKILAKIFLQFDFFDQEGLRSKFESYNNNYWAYPDPEFFCDTLRGSVILNGREKVFKDTYVFIGENPATLALLKDYIYTPPEAMCYNDLIDSHTYAPYVLRYNKPLYFIPRRQNVIKFQVGVAAPCVCCNGNRNVEYSDTMLCRDCLVKYGPEDHEALTWCENCGCRIIREYSHYDEDSDSYYCEECVKKLEYTTCERCGNIHRRSCLKQYGPDNRLLCRACATDEGFKKQIFFW